MKDSTTTRRAFLKATAAAGVSCKISQDAQAGQPKPLLLGGPMVGHTTDTSARIWARSCEPAAMTAVISKMPNLKEAKSSKVVKCLQDNDLAGVALLEKLEPGTRYYYDVLLDGKAQLKPPYPSFRTYPAEGKPGKVRVLVGGCVRFQVDPVQPIWNAMAGQEANAMILLGDNVYADNYIRGDKYFKELDLGGNEQYMEKRPERGYRGKRAGNFLFPRVYHRIQQSLPTYRNFIARTPVYATWDDHDAYGDGSGGARLPMKLRRQAVQAFRENFVNPYYGGGENTPGIWCHFAIADVEFFLLDGRTYREGGSKKDRRFLGEEEERWLKDRLANSQAAFKFIISGSPWNNQPKGNTKLTEENYYGRFGDTLASFKWRRDELLKFIIDKKIPGVVLVSGDRHRAEVVKVWPRGLDQHVFHDMNTCNIASRTQRPAGKIGENGLVYVYSGRNFGVLDIDTTRKPATVTYSIWGHTSRKKPPVKQYAITLKATDFLPVAMG